MLQLVEALNLGSGAAVVAVLSAIAGLVCAGARSPRAAYLGAVGSAFVLACLLYWSPVLLGATSSEFGSWFPVFLAYWFPAGACAAGAAVFLRRRLSKREASHA
jgi:lipopolysaccharide export LptBFGC system permease protein LptF